MIHKIIIKSGLIVLFSAISGVASAQDEIKEKEDVVSEPSDKAPVQPEPSVAEEQPAQEAAMQEPVEEETEEQPVQEAETVPGPEAQELAVMDQSPLVAEPPIQAKNTRKPGRGLIISGWAVFGGGYLISCVNGIMLVGEEDRAWYLFIPVFGSAMYGVHIIDDNTNGDGFDPLIRFVGMLLFIPSIVQITGITLATLGHVKGARWKKQNAVAFAPVGPGGTPGLSISGRFSF